MRQLGQTDIRRRRRDIAEGDSIAEIVDALKWSVDEVKGVLKKCRKSGLYAKYALQSYKLGKINPELYEKLLRECVENG